MRKGDHRVSFLINEVSQVAVIRKKIRLTIMIVAAAVIIYFLWIVRSGLYPFIVAVFFAYLLNPAVCALEEKGLRRPVAIFVVYGIVFGLLIVAGTYGIPVLIRELENFGRELPQMMAKGEEVMQAIQFTYQNSLLPYSLRIALDNALLSLQDEVQQFIAEVVNSLIGLISYTIGLVITPILAFYILNDWYELKDKLLQLLPVKWRQEWLMTCCDFDKVLSGVIRGQLTVALIVGILVTIGLRLLDVPYSLLIGILAGMLDIIPYFGAFIGATPAVTLALLTSPVLALKVVILFFVIHQLEGTVIGPKILGESVGLHPLSVIFFVFIGGEMAGLAGMLLGVPLAALGKVVVRHVIRLVL